jgi:hypothetical protein
LALRALALEAVPAPVGSSAAEALAPVGLSAEVPVYLSRLQRTRLDRTEQPSAAAPRTSGQALV